MIRNPKLALLLYLVLVAAAAGALGMGLGARLIELANLALYLAVALTLGWFLYAVVLRKLWRAKHIRSLRENRMLREATERRARRP